MSHETLVIGKGEKLLDLRMRRTSKGLFVDVRAHAAVEEVFRTWGNSQQTSAHTHDRYWREQDGAGPLQCWSLLELFPAMPLGTSGKLQYRVDRLGTQLLEGEDQLLRREGSRVGTGVPGLTVNIGFLRLVGISASEGVQFYVRGVYTLDGIKDISAKVIEATKKFVADYLKPVELSFELSIRE
jgi:hypothetical protein